MAKRLLGALEGHGRRHLGGRVPRNVYYCWKYAETHPGSGWLTVLSRLRASTSRED